MQPEQLGTFKQELWPSNSARLPLLPKHGKGLTAGNVAHLKDLLQPRTHQLTADVNSEVQLVCWDDQGIDQLETGYLKKYPTQNPRQNKPGFIPSPWKNRPSSCCAQEKPITNVRQMTSDPRETLSSLFPCSQAARRILGRAIPSMPPRCQSSDHPAWA